MRFEKFEGLGNDFLVVDVRDQAESAALDRFSSRFVSALCDRHFGVGGDGVLLVLPAVNPTSQARMVVLNADGSRPEMCGNGLRCVAAFVAAERTDTSLSLLIDTDAGQKQCVVRNNVVQIDMGVANDLGFVDIEAKGRDGTIRHFRLRSIRTGNPHAITFEPHPEGVFDNYGLALATHQNFAEGSNIEFARVHNGVIDVRVWERGVGPTLACGTGACATTVAACLAGLVPYEKNVTVNLPGGALEISVSPEHAIVMTGPAQRVFVGEWTR